jgi:conjugative transposon TraN protein
MVFLTLAIAGFFLESVAQVTQKIDPVNLQVSDIRTTNLIFPYPIVGIDRGNKDVLVQKAKGAENILQVKVSSSGFCGSNLSVITNDGSLYSFALTYAEIPFLLNLTLKEGAVGEGPVQFSDKGENKGIIGRMADKVTAKQPFIRHKRDKYFDISFALQGIYIHNDLLYFQLQAVNSSELNYDVDQLRLFIQDRNQTKRTASQEQELAPIYVGGNTKRISANSNQSIVVVLPKFTFPDKKKMVIQLMEANGGRHLRLEVKYKALRKAVAIK